MSRWELLDTAPVPSSETELRLYRRADAFAIRVPGFGELMNSRTHGSEDVLGQRSAERFAKRGAVRMLVGGLGMGFTLRAALDVLATDATVVVAELVPEVVGWNQELLGACAGHPVRDPRVQIRIADVAAVLREADEAYDGIVLDVDNGPEGLTRRANDRLYSSQGLAEAMHALRPGGVLAIWSAGPDRAFTGELYKVGFEVEEARVRAHGNKGARHVIWFARRPL